MDKPFHIHKSLLAALRKNVDMDGKAVQDNYRPTQGVNDRTVYHHEFNVDMSGGGGGFDGPCFVTGAVPDGLRPLRLEYFSTDMGDRCPGEAGNIDCAGLTADLAGAETCQGYCELTPDCQTFYHSCRSETICGCILSNTTEWASLPQQVEWVNVTTPSGDWFGPETGCQTEITSAPGPTCTAELNEECQTNEDCCCEGCECVEFRDGIVCRNPNI